MKITDQHLTEIKAWAVFDLDGDSRIENRIGVQAIVDEVRQLRAMRAALVDLRDRIDAAHLDEGWSYVDRINAVLALAPG